MSFWRRGGWGQDGQMGAVFSWASQAGHCDEPWAKNCVRFLPQFLSLISMVREGTRKTPVPSPPCPQSAALVPDSPSVPA